MPPAGSTQWPWSLEEWTSLNLLATETALVSDGNTPGSHKVIHGWNLMAYIHNSMWRSAPGAKQISSGDELANAYHARWRPEKTRKWRQFVLRSSGNWSVAEMAARRDLRLMIEAWATHLGVQLGVNPFRGVDGVGGNITPTNLQPGDAKVNAQWRGGQGQVVPGDPALGTTMPPSPPGWVGAWPPVLFGPALPPAGLPVLPPPQPAPQVIPTSAPAPVVPAPAPVNPAVPAQTPTMAQQPATAQGEDDEVEEESAGEEDDDIEEEPAGEEKSVGEGESAGEEDPAAEEAVSTGDEPGRAPPGKGDDEVPPTDQGERSVTNSSQNASWVRAENDRMTWELTKQRQGRSLF